MNFVLGNLPGILGQSFGDTLDENQVIEVNKSQFFVNKQVQFASSNIYPLQQVSQSERVI